MYDHILVPTDGSDHAARAADHAAVLAPHFDATVHILHVVDVPAAAGAFDAGGVDRSFVDTLESAGADVLDELERRFPESCRIERDIVHGSPGSAIVEYVEAAEVDLVAMGTQGRTGLDRLVAGSVTERVVLQSPVPVLTTRASAPVPENVYERLLVPTDGSEPSMAAVEDAIAVAAMDGATVHVLNVVETGSLAAGIEGSIEQVRTALREAGHRAVEDVADRVGSADLPVETAVREGVAASTITAYADEQDVDAIVMGTAGRTGLARHLIGSTTAQVVREASRPVFTVPGVE